MKLRLVGALALVLLAACTPKVDSSSEAALFKSLKAVGESVPPEQRQALAMDVATLAPEIDGALVVARLNPAQGKEVLAKAASQIEGLTAEEIRVKAPIVRAEAKARKKADEIRYLETSIANVKEKLADYTAAKVNLTKFSAAVVRTLPSSPPDDPFGAVELDLTNGMDIKAHRVWYTFSVANGAQTEWATDKVLPADIPPGGSARVQVPLGSLNSFDRQVTITTVRVTRVESGGSASAGDFSQDAGLAQYELSKLQEQLKAAQAQ
jgi:hypothetical protein